MRHLLLIMAMMSAASSWAETALTSIAILYETPSSYDRKFVEVPGWFYMHFDGDVICESKVFVVAQCIEISLDQRDAFHSFHGKRVRIEGQFYREELDYKPVSRDGNALSIQLGPIFHKLVSIKAIEFE